MKEARNVARPGIDLADAFVLGLGALAPGAIYVALGVGADLSGPGVLAGVIVSGILAIVSGSASVALATIGRAHTGEAAEAGMVHAARIAVFWALAAARVAGAAAVSSVFAAYIAPRAPEGIQHVIAAGLLVAVAALLVAGVRPTLKLTGFLLALACAGLAFFVGTALPLLDGRNFHPFLTHGWGGMLRSAGLLAVTYGGLEHLSGMAPQMEHPKRTTINATMLSLLAAMVLNGVVAISAIGVAGLIFSGRNLISGRPNNAPLLAAAALTRQPGVAHWAVTVGAAAGTALVVLSILHDLSRHSLRMARAGDLPKAFGAMMPGVDIPWPPLFIGAILAALSTMVDGPTLLTIAAFFLLLDWALRNLLAWPLFNPGRKALHAVAILVCLTLAAMLLLRH